ncbi:MAG: prepilin-type N-terminal cleavage/methylation domain-containing protein [Candidatus Thiodiazotropha sp. (ex Dulcina madagascariensis)]|nr:prepilin-type N-terminal cleavage/methylation domain-containing protein [Candidatus Thiodiazotropha sp. (ex Dulcina madagascariensis)]MCU7926027.1 prepilin-type N-terminal cleavage/methylation domain-containing protein [Candidatus Thiodiazotropha sp. (ex Dulcina madagascariensis)]
MIKPIKYSGFTLMEVMIAVLIVGILAAIAYPSYENSIRKGRRNDAMVTLTVAAQKLDVFRARTATYTIDPALANIMVTSPEGYYGNLTIVAGLCGNIASCYTLEIEPTAKNGQDEDTITGFRLHSTGVRERNEWGWTPGWK